MRSEHKWVTVRVLDKSSLSVAVRHHAIHDHDLEEAVFDLIHRAAEEIGAARNYLPMTPKAPEPEYKLETDQHTVLVEVSDAYTEEQLVELGLLGEDVITLDAKTWGGLWSDRDARELTEMI